MIREAPDARISPKVIFSCRGIGARPLYHRSVRMYGLRSETNRRSGAALLAFGVIGWVVVAERPPKSQVRIEAARTLAADLSAGLLRREGGLSLPAPRLGPFLLPYRRGGRHGAGSLDYSVPSGRIYSL